MKKKVLLSLVLATFFFAGCQKMESHVGTSNRVIREQDGSKTSNAYLLWFFSGHEGKNCPGCAMVGGKLVHVECHGHGSKCHKAAKVILNQADTNITATTTDTFDLTSDDFFLMPDRSLEYTDDNDNHVFLNIPGQMVYRDSTTLQFTFTGLSITSTPAYGNY